MTLSECYEEMGADLHEVLRRLKTEERIGKFLKLVLTDTNYEALCKALEEKDYNPIDQLVGYLISGDPSYITSYNNARTMIKSIDRDELIAEMLREYVEVEK